MPVPKAICSRLLVNELLHAVRKVAAGEAIEQEVSKKVEYRNHIEFMRT